MIITASSLKNFPDNKEIYSLWLEDSKWTYKVYKNKETKEGSHITSDRFDTIKEAIYNAMDKELDLLVIDKFIKLASETI